MKELVLKMSKTAVVIGSQWGDEGKGKITNYLSEKAQVVVRFQGGDNAGHTISFDDNVYKLHLIPSGIFNKKTKNILGNGTVINPRSLLTEIESLKMRGINCDNLFISDRAHVVFDFNIRIDIVNEEKLGDQKIGTTKKGIGPTYMDKASRTGIRMADFISSDFRALYIKQGNRKNEEIAYLGGDPIDVVGSLKEYEQIAKKIAPYVTDTVTIINEAYDNGEKILFEGAQGALLDIDFGTYPYVTSSNTSTGGVSSGSGLAFNKIEEVIGIVKAYTSRVGNGPFPSELVDEIGKSIREKGNEYGTTTKRPRRIGWFDAVVLKYSVMINGITGLSLMLLDVLTGLDELQICTGYLIDGKEVKNIPARHQDYSKCEPVYITLPGWNEDISMVKAFDKLPVNTQNYIKKIEELVGVEVCYFSVGPNRNQTIIRKEMF
jgi:adenylosuccinate synthase